MGAVFRLTGNTVMPAPGVRVLRAADYARLVEANDVLAAARERAAAMAAEAEKAYEERRQAGYEDGLMEGRMEQAEKMMETAMQAVEYIEGVEAKLVPAACAHPCLSRRQGRGADLAGGHDLVRSQRRHVSGRDGRSPHEARGLHPGM